VPRELEKSPLLLRCHVRWQETLSPDPQAPPYLESMCWPKATWKRSFPQYRAEQGAGSENKGQVLELAPSSRAML
jgi:hypothetical protein